MKPVTLIGVALITLGVLALAYYAPDKAPPVGGDYEVLRIAPQTQLEERAGLEFWRTADGCGSFVLQAGGLGRSRGVIRATRDVIDARRVEKRGPASCTSPTSTATGRIPSAGVPLRAKGWAIGDHCVPPVGPVGLWDAGGVTDTGASPLRFFRLCRASASSIECECVRLVSRFASATSPW